MISFYFIILFFFSFIFTIIFISALEDFPHIFAGMMQETVNSTKYMHIPRRVISQESSNVKKPRCGGSDHSKLTRPCSFNDTICGHWNQRYWHPSNCEYDNITPEQARKCLGSHTLAFLGDSTLRNLGVAVALFLLGQDLDTASEHKYYYTKHANLSGLQIPNFQEWKHNVLPYLGNGHIFPHPNITQSQGDTWQIQVWNLFRNEFQENQAEQVLSNSMRKKFPLLHKIDLAFWSHGLHDHGWFSSPPYGKKFYDNIFSRWLNMRYSVDTPSVWVSINPECAPREKISRLDNQEYIMDEVNWYVNNQTLSNKIPYWDAGAVLRSSERCNKSVDGVHVKMYVDIMRAKMLFNHFM